MGQVLHGCATTTEAVRRAIQHSQKSLRALASLRDQPEDRRQVEEAQLGRRSADRSKDAASTVPSSRGRSDRSSPSVGTRSCRSTTVFTPFSRPSRI